MEQSSFRIDPFYNVIWRDMDFSTLLRLSRTNKEFRKIMQDQSTWVFLLQRDFGIKYSVDAPKWLLSPKDLYYYIYATLFHTSITSWLKEIGVSSKTEYTIKEFYSKNFYDNVYDTIIRSNVPNKSEVIKELQRRFNEHIIDDNEDNLSKIKDIIKFLTLYNNRLSKYRANLKNFSPLFLSTVTLSYVIRGYNIDITINIDTYNIDVEQHGIYVFSYESNNFETILDLLDYFATTPKNKTDLQSVKKVANDTEDEIHEIWPYGHPGAVDLAEYVQKYISKEQYDEDIEYIRSVT